MTTATDDNDFSLPLAVILSLLVHVGLFFLMHQTIKNGTNPDEQNPAQVFDVTVVPDAPKQIVSKTESQPEAKPVETNRQSDTDSYVVKEQIKRGLEPVLSVPGEKSPTKEKLVKDKPTKAEKPAPKPEKPAKAKAAEEPPAPPPASQKPEPKKVAAPKLSLSDLTLDSKDLLSNFSQNSSDTNSSKQSGKNQNSRSQAYRGAFSRPPGSGAQFMSSAGSADYIPNVPDGDLTLLNAKANQFAVFVRRVAIQVFTQIRTLGWDNLGRSDIENIRDYATVIAIMSPKGDLLKVTLDGSSASASFDSIIMKAAKAGTKDPNPPAAAKASDGNIRFIFKAKSWVETDRGRSGIPVERRWILLETGLE